MEVLFLGQFKAGQAGLMMIIFLVFGLNSVLICLKISISLHVVQFYKCAVIQKRLNVNQSA